MISLVLYCDNKQLGTLKFDGEERLLPKSAKILKKNIVDNLEVSPIIANTIILTMMGKYTKELQIMGNFNCNSISCRFMEKAFLEK